MNQDISFEIIRQISEAYGGLLLTLMKRINKLLRFSNIDNVTVASMRESVLQMIREEIAALHVDKLVAKTLMSAVQSNLSDWVVELRHVGIDLTPDQLEILLLRGRKQLKIAYTEIMVRAKMIESQMLQKASWVARDVIAEITTAKRLGVPIGESMKTVEPLINQFDFVDKTGKKWNPQSYIEMVARTQSAKVAADSSKNLANEIDNDLRIIDIQAGACPICFPFHDNVISMNERASADEIKEINDDGFTYYGTFAQAESIGFYHPNCRCLINVYFTGVTQHSLRTDEAKNSKNYQDRQTQRQMERQIRKYKTKEVSYLTKSEQAKAHQKVLEWQKKLREFAKENNLTRMYWRERLEFSVKSSGTWQKNFILNKTLHLDKAFLEEIIKI